MQIDGDIADLVEEQRAFVRQLETAHPGHRRSRERSFFVSEQFAFDQAGRKRGAAEPDERALSPRAQIVDRAREELLSRAGLAKEQNRGAGRRDNPGGFEDALQRCTSADDLAKALSEAKLVLEVTRLLLQLIPLGLNRRGVLLHAVEVDAVVHGDGDDGRHLFHERDGVGQVVAGVGAPETEDAQTAVARGQRQPAGDRSPAIPDEFERGMKHAVRGDRNNSCLLRLPDNGPRASGRNRQRLIRQGRKISGLEHRQAHLVAGRIVQRQGEVVEGDNRVELVRKDAEQFGKTPVAGKDPRGAEKRLVSRQRVPVEC